MSYGPYCVDGVDSALLELVHGFFQHVLASAHDRYLRTCGVVLSEDVLT